MHEAKQWETHLKDLKSFLVPVIASSLFADGEPTPELFLHVLYILDSVQTAPEHLDRAALSQKYVWVFALSLSSILL